MFKVTKKPKTPNMIWDSEKNCLLCKFVKGIFETDDAGVADKLESMGHTVTAVQMGVVGVPAALV